MVTYGLGSSTSPIIIDDSDDESADARLVAQQLQPTSTATSPSPPGSARMVEVPSSETNDDEHILVSDDSPEELAETIREGKGYNILLRMGYRPGQGLGPHLEGLTRPITTSLKRKWYQAGLGTVEPPKARTVTRSSAVLANTETDPRQETRNERPVLAEMQQNPKVQILEAPPHRETQATPLRLAIQEYKPRTKRQLSPLSERAHQSPGSRGFPSDIVATPLSSNYQSLHQLSQTQLSSFQPHSTAFGNLDWPSMGGALFSSQFPHHSPDTSTMASISPGVGTPHALAPFPVPSSLNPQQALSEPAKEEPIVRKPFPLPSKPSFSPQLSISSANSKAEKASNTKANPPTTSLVEVKLPFRIPYAPLDHRILGMPPDHKLPCPRGTFPTEDLSPLPELDRTLVMETIPRKFRSVEFIHEWLASLDSPPTRRIELAHTKALIEFKTREAAHRAFESRRMAGLEGLGGVRVWFYRPPTRELEPGEVVETSDVTQGPKKSKKKKVKGPPAAAVVPLPVLVSEATRTSPEVPPERFNPSTSKNHIPLVAPLNTFVPPPLPLPPLPPPPPLYTSRFGPPMAVDSCAVSRGVSSDVAITVPPMIESPPLPPSILPIQRRAVYDSDEDMDIESSPPASQRPSPIKLLRNTLPDLIASPPAAAPPDTMLDHVTHDVPCQYKESTTTSAPPTPPKLVNQILAPSIPVISSRPTSSSPTPSSSAVTGSILEPATFVAKDQLLARQKESEESIANAKAEIHNSKARISSVSPLPKPSATTASESSLELGKEASLRRMVLLSKRKRRPEPQPDVVSDPNALLEPVTQGNFGPSSAIATSTNFSTVVNLTAAATPAALRDLADSFINDAIHSIRPPPPKRFKKMPEKSDLAARQRELEIHIEETKKLMARLQTAKTRQEKDVILISLRERNRLIEDTKSRSTTPGEHPPPNHAAKLTYPQSGSQQKYRWPETTHETYILVISDSEGDDDDDDSS